MGAMYDMTAMKLKAERMYSWALGTGDKRMAEIFKNAAVQLIEHQNPMYFGGLGLLNKIPVTIDEFVESKEFIADFMEVWPALRDDLRAYNPDVFIGEEPIYETVDGGATRTGKSVKALITQAYQLYLMTCFTEPTRLFKGISSITPITVLFQSVQERVTRRVLYEPFRQMFLGMPYTKKWVKHDKYKESTLKLDVGQAGIEVVPALASLTAMVGQAVLSALLDEVNFMSVVENSKNVTGARGQGGLYDQAEIVHTNITRRRAGTFSTRGLSVGCISVLSSTRYRGDFLDKRIALIEKNEEKNVVYRRRAQYEVRDPDTYCGEKFQLLVGSTDYATTILQPGAKMGVDYPTSATVKEIPVEFLKSFQIDPEGALRDVCGISTDVIAPFITRRDKIIASVLRAKEKELVPFVHRQNVILGLDSLPIIHEHLLPEDKDNPRYIHVDLSRTGDRVGLCMVKEVDMIEVETADKLVEFMPQIECELAISIEPNAANPIDPTDIRSWILALKKVYGLNIKKVTYDNFDSRESILLLRKAGIQSAVVSMDKTREPYVVLRTALYQDRLDMVDNDILRVELSNLEDHTDTDKIDHPPRGSKDISDALAGAVYTLTTSRATRNKLGVSKVTVRDEQEESDDTGTIVRLSAKAGPRRAPKRRQVKRK